MTRERLNELWPVMEHFRNGGEVECRENGHDAMHWTGTECPCFSDTDLVFRIKPPTRLVPLDAEDWMQGGPWWVKAENGTMRLCIWIGQASIGFIHATDMLYLSLQTLFNDGYQRRSASDPESSWVACSKLKPDPDGTGKMIEDLTRNEP